MSGRDEHDDDDQTVVGCDLGGAGGADVDDDDDLALLLAGGLASEDRPRFDARAEVTASLEGPVEPARPEPPPTDLPIARIVGLPAELIPERSAERVPDEREDLAAQPSPDLVAEMSGEMSADRGATPTARHPAIVFAHRHPRPLGAVGVLLILWLLWPASRAPLPDYAIEGPFGGAIPERTAMDEEESPQFRASSTVRIVVRPEKAAADPPEHAQFLIQSSVDRRLAPEAAVTVDERGVVRLESRAGDLFHRAGEYTIYTVVGAVFEDPLQVDLDALQIQVTADGGQWLSTQLAYRP